MPLRHTKWWTKRYSAVLAIIVVSNILLDRVAFRLMDGEALTGFMIGHLLAQLFLMGLWLAFGGLHFMIRFAVVAIITPSRRCVTYSGMNPSLSSSAMQALVVGAGMIVLGTQAIVIPMRWLLGWRFDFDRAYHATPNYGKMQLGLIHILGLMTSTALPFAWRNCSLCSLMRLIGDL